MEIIPSQKLANKNSMETKIATIKNPFLVDLKSSCFSLIEFFKSIFLV